MALNDLERQNARSPVFAVDLRIYARTVCPTASKLCTVIHVRKWRVFSSQPRPHFKEAGPSATHVDRISYSRQLDWDAKTARS